MTFLFDENGGKSIKSPIVQYKENGENDTKTTRQMSKLQTQKNYD